MRFFLISDNSDAMNGLRLAGIEGTVARSEADLRQALENAAKQPDIAVLLVTGQCPEDAAEKNPNPSPTPPENSPTPGARNSCGIPRPGK